MNQELYDRATALLNSIERTKTITKHLEDAVNSTCQTISNRYFPYNAPNEDGFDEVFPELRTKLLQEIEKKMSAEISRLKTQFENL